MAGPMAIRIRQKLTALSPSVIEIIDDSLSHAGHAGMKGKKPSESHFKVIVVSDKFDGVKPLKRHQLIYEALSEEMKEIHALNIVAKTPKEITNAK